MIKGLISILATLPVVISMLMNWVALAQLREIGTRMHLAAYSSSHHEEENTHKGAHVHKHRHADNEPEHEHAHVDPGYSGALSAFDFSQPGEYGVISFEFTHETSFVANDDIPANQAPASLFRPPRA